MLTGKQRVKLLDLHLKAICVQLHLRCSKKNNEPCSIVHGIIDRSEALSCNVTNKSSATANWNPLENAIRKIKTTQFTDYSNKNDNVRPTKA